jgi:hypothetical protein
VDEDEGGSIDCGLPYGRRDIVGHIGRRKKNRGAELIREGCCDTGCEKGTGDGK